ncbi:MAG: putative manganese-dependent inorganic diphosphatase [Clostridia bacterium]|nr:putative manganese-dependent inorganic diphosphatase [Clostridia bacterium]
MIHIFGHKNPDTDSIVSAIALSHLRQSQGVECVPYRLGDVNKESKFVIDRFGFEAPKLLKSVKPVVQDLNYDKPDSLKGTDSILCAYEKMHEMNSKILGVTDDDERLVGLVTMKDIAMSFIDGEYSRVNTLLSNMEEVLEATVVNVGRKDIAGNVAIAAYYQDTLMEGDYFDEDTILVVGNRFDIIEYALKKNVCLLVVTGGNELSDEVMATIKSSDVSVIMTDFDTYKTSQYILQANMVKTIMTKGDLVKFYEDDLVDDIKETLLSSKHSNFPVVDLHNRYLGFMGRRHLLKPNRKQVMLVDHNEYRQSIDGLSEAEIVEIIDHHKIGDISTKQPVTFINSPVGSTSTIIYQQYLLNRVRMPNHIAGLLLAGVLSDTLNLKSPTTTYLDREAVKELNLLCNVDVDTFFMEMFKAGTSLEGISEEEIFYKDFKEFGNEGSKIGVSQVYTLDIEDVQKRQDKIMEVLTAVHENNRYDMTFMLVTDVSKNGSYVYYQTSLPAVMSMIFDRPLEQGIFIDELVSRKKQVIPRIFDAIDTHGKA